MDKSIALYLFVSFVACVTPGSGVLYTILKVVQNRHDTQVKMTF